MYDSLAMVSDVCHPSISMGFIPMNDWFATTTFRWFGTCESGDILAFPRKMITFSGLVSNVLLVLVLVYIFHSSIEI